MICMRTTLNLDEQLIREAGRLTGLRVKTEVIHEGLRALITRESARRLRDEALAMVQALGDRRCIARSLSNCCWSVSDQGDHGRARSLGEEALVIFRELGDVDAEAIVLHALGTIAIRQGDLVAARNSCGPGGWGPGLSGLDALDCRGK